MGLSSRPLHNPCKFATRKCPTSSIRSRAAATVHPTSLNKTSSDNKKTLDHWLHPLKHKSSGGYAAVRPTPAWLGKRWMEYQGVCNWDGLLDPLDDNLRYEILRYGNFVDAAYKAFDFDLSSTTYAGRKFSKASLFERCGFPYTGYRITKDLRATTGINLPSWVRNAPSWVATESSWIGYVAVCEDKQEIARLGRRDIVISFRGTATCLEWLENLRATLSHIPSANGNKKLKAGISQPMVESGFLSLYTSQSSEFSSLKETVREEIMRLLLTYRDEPLSLTITGHSLGAALATLTAYDIQMSFRRPPLITVISFGGPRVGDRAFRKQLERQGTRVLRIVNSDDVITKVPGFTIDDIEDHDTPINNMAEFPRWIRKRMVGTQWVYAEVGEELRLCSRNSPHLKGIDIATCHDLKTYLHLVNGFVSSNCPFRPIAKTLLTRHF